MAHNGFIDIFRVKEEDSEFGLANIAGFEVGDHIVVQEKVDGANSSFAYNSKEKKLDVFSPNKRLDENNTFNGFWDWAQTLDVEKFAKYPNYKFYGEWLVQHTIPYKWDAYKKFYFYDVWDKEIEKYLPQSEVKRLAEELNLNYVKTFYDGPFISWEHCRSFAGQSDIAEELGEGVVIKNQSKLNNPDETTPFVLKIITERFSEIKRENHRIKIEDPLKMEARAKSQVIVDQIVTENRIRKDLYKMIDEGLLPEKLRPQDMSIVAQNLPNRIIVDCIKEEPEMVMKAGKYFNRLCGKTSMEWAKKIIFGEG